ncbi:hypothetical protein [Lacinutrix sp. Bg11-31]|uniref:hypothetical protein n=1 Tax=Lacinutrix sp. Bg11-31 TaxID=2057808 RepID=UPI000C30E94F|nr:hypothetical protein [Lacinutrix sp. Bg11-31]AUC82846.1 hypothetical protein CW733_12220 [Lacinutrix sp. Bg11-31]
MLKKHISIFFTILFLAIITAPSIIMVLDDTVDISVFYSLSEEEEEVQNLKLLFSNNEEELDYLSNVLKTNNLGYFFKNYSKPHLNLISPPPDFI